MKKKKFGDHPYPPKKPILDDKSRNGLFLQDGFWNFARAPKQQKF